MTTRETTFRESDHPGIVFPGNVFPGKKPSGKVTIRETTVYPSKPSNLRRRKLFHFYRQKYVQHFDVMHAVNVVNSNYTLCLKKYTNFETIQLEIIRIDFDEIWQKYTQKTLEQSLYVSVFM